MGLIESPEGREGMVKQVVGVPPEIVGDTVLIATLYCNERFELENEMAVGAVAEEETSILIDPVVLPAEFEAVIV